MLPYSVKKLGRVILSPRYHLRILMNDAKALAGFFSYPSKVIFVAGLPKSGTTWLENYISHIPGYNPRVLFGSRDLLTLNRLPGNAFSKIPKYGYSAIKTHILPTGENADVLVENNVTKIIIMYRDLRDVAVSLYYFLRDNPWEQSDDQADYQGMGKEQGLSHIVNEVTDSYASWVIGWMEVAKTRKDIEFKFIKYEDLLSDSIGVFQSVLSFYDIRISDEEFDSVMSAIHDDRNRKKSKSLLYLPGNRTTKRKGIAGEWKKELNGEQKKIFREKVGALLVELGYENDLNW